MPEREIKRDAQAVALLATECRRLSTTTRGKPAQTPGEIWEFRCGHSVVLPDLGSNSESVIWNPSRVSSRGGAWLCRVCQRKVVQRRRQGLGKTGLLGRIKNLLLRGREVAKSEGHLPPNSTPERVLARYEFQNGRCAACHRLIDLLKPRGCAMDHCHATGRVRAFLCPLCNFAEGILKNYTDEQFKNFAAYRQHCQTLNRKEIA